MKRSLLSLLIGSLASMPAAQAFVVSDIRIEGLQRLSDGTVLNALPIDVGDDVQTMQISGAARALYKTGYFDDIRMGQSDNVLVVSVVERPSISAIEIKGNKAIKEEDLMKGLAQAGLAEGEIFQRATLESIRKELERQYVAQGRYSARVTTRIDELPNNRVKLNVDVKEGRVASISHINVVGNTVFTSDELSDLFQLRKTRWYDFFGSADKYSREKLAGDLERLKSWYLDRGYTNFDVASTQVSIGSDKEKIFITVNINEGDKFSVSEVKLAGELMIAETEAEKMLLVSSGETFSREAITATEEGLTRRLGEEGYAFAKVTAVPKVNQDNKTVEITFFVEPGRKVYVRRINFEGNTKTGDEVLRREMRQMESSMASSDQIELSKVRLERLGFFKTVNVETTPVPGTTDQIDLTYAVEEQPSGNVTASIGYSQSDGLLLGGSISQNNFLGTGNEVSIGLNKSDVSQLYNFSFMDPYYTVDGVSRGFDVYYRSYDYSDTDISSYAADTFGGNIRFGYPLSETDSVNFSIGVDGTTIVTGGGTPEAILDYLAKEGDKFTNFKASLGWSQSALNRGLLPTDGYSQSVTLSAAVPGSTATFYKLMYRGQYFQPLFADFTARFSTRLGYAGAYGDTSEVPFFENFYAGGFGSVRGYRDNSLGPKAKQRDDNDYNSMGGDVLLEGSIELLFPLPFVKDQSSLRTSAFFDFGNVFDTACSPYVVDCADVSFKEIRYSVGVGLTWITPLGPLTFSLAKALNPKGKDETQTFQFSLGTPF